MEFDVLFGGAKAKPKKGATPRGCAHCPLNEVAGVKKIMGSVYGRDILIVGQSPGPEENQAGKEFVGRSGEFLWDELDRVGIIHKDCDIFNAVKCFPCDPEESSYNTYLKMRSPSQQEIHCCSIHTEKILEKTKARFILVLGQLAQKAFLNVRSVPSKKIFWSEEHQATIYLGDHPSFFIRGYGQGERLAGFRSLIQSLADSWRGSGSPREHAAPVAAPRSFGYMRKQRYYLITDREQARKADHFIRKCAIAKGHRVAADIEDDIIDGTDERHVFAVGFSPFPGIAFTFMIRENESVRRIATALLEDAEIKKAFQYGCTDVVKLYDTEGISVEGFDIDTNLGSYLMEPGLGAYGLDAIAMRQFPEFTGYKDEVVEELIKVLPKDVVLPKSFNSAKATTKSKGKWLSANGHYRLSRLPNEIIRLYNGADCDLTKRIEMTMVGAPEIPPALMRLYTDLSFVLQEMQSNGPYFDRRQHAALSTIYEYKEQKKLDELRRCIKDKNFNPGSPPQVMDFLYGEDRLGLKYPFRLKKDEKINSRKKTLLMLKKYHPFPQLLIDWRKLNKGNSTYIKGYKICADLNDGHLRTKWNATGTATGRLSSGGKLEDPGVINFQNIHKDPQLQNMCVADIRWREVMKAIHDIVKHQPEGDWEVCIEAWIRSEMPDLKTYLMLDYGQVEVRVAAQISGDKNLLKDCMDADIHTTVGVRMTGWSADMIKNDNATRTLTKNVHFGILFGISKENLYDFIIAMTPPPRDKAEEEARAKNPITPERVSEMYDRYFARYKGIRHMIDNYRDFARENGYVETLFGMRRKLNVTDDDDEQEFIGDDEDERGTYWGNQAVNTPVQGSAHQLMECALINLKRKPDKYKVLGVPNLEVHDALYMTVLVLDLFDAKKRAKYLLEKESLATVASDFPDINWVVPIVTEAEAGIRLGCKIALDENVTSVGAYMLAWYNKCKKQIKDLNMQLEEVAAAA